MLNYKAISSGLASVSGYAKFSLVVMLLIMATSFNAVYARDTLLKKENLSVAKIKHTIKSGKFSVLKIKRENASEGAPSEVKFYYAGEILRAVVVSVGHEVWLNQFEYYFDKNGKILKYVKITSRPDNPGRKGIIYHNEKIIWKNIEEPVVSIKTIIKLFGDLMKAEKSIATY